jgi:scyllo-inositol 2-dehydrogenase (NADP+)
MATFKKPSEIKVGVIGYGGAFNMGRQHLQQMQQAGMTPVAVAEIDESRLKVAQTDFPGIQTYTSVATMLRKSDVNLVTIITPHNTHAPLALQCLKAGRSVVCEKPLAITTAECDAMIREAKKRKLVISTYHNRHWDGCVLEAMDRIVKQKAIGDVYRIQCNMGGYSKPGDWWRTSRTISGGILYDWGVHLLEYSLQIMRQDIAEVSGYAHEGFWAPHTRWKRDSNEDAACAVVRFKKGQWLSLNITHLDANVRRPMLEITGTKGTYLMDHSTWEIITPGEKGYTTVTRGPNRKSTGDKFYQNIADHLTRGKPLVITGEWSRRPIHILDLAVQSAKKGAAIKARYA